MIDAFIVINLVMLGCIGLGVLLGWVLWGNDMKCYKDLYEKYKTLYYSPEEREARMQKSCKDSFNRCMKSHHEFTKNDKLSKGVRGEYGIIEHYHEIKG